MEYSRGKKGKLHGKDVVDLAHGTSNADDSSSDDDDDENDDDENDDDENDDSSCEY